MSEYKNIKGKTVQSLGTDPSETSTEGQVWYNSAGGAFKSLLALEAWSAGGNLITAVFSNAGAGTQTAGLGFGGYTDGSTRTNATVEYNGSGWASGGNLINSPASGNGAGTQTAGLAFGGAIPPGTVNTDVSQEYDGSSWTAGGSMADARRSIGGAGTQTAGLGFGGYSPGPDNETEEYNGTSWTAGGNLVTQNAGIEGTGSQTAAIAFGGSPPGGITAVAQYYDGSSWTAVASMNTARSNLGSAGTQTAALAFAGNDPSGANTETWDGTSWTEGSNLATGRGNLGGLGTTSSAALAFGGQTPPPSSSLTEEYNKSVNVITSAAWASGGTQNTSRVYSGGSGPVTSALIIGGFVGPGLGGFNDAAETYNGTSWTTITNFPYNAVGLLGLGNAEAFVGGAGYKNNATHVLDSVEYDGSSWTAGNNMNQLGQGGEGTGSQTAGLAGNRSTAPGAQAEEYDGTSWSNTPLTNTAGEAGAGMAGTQTAALMYGASPSPLHKRTESYDGTSWTTENDLNVGRRFGSMGGSQTAAFFGGGNINPPTSNVALTEQYDGTTWGTSVNMGTARFYQRGGAQTASSTHLATSGTPDGSTISAATEEFTGETSAINIKTLTTS